MGAGGGLQGWVFFHLQSTLKVPFRADGRQLLAGLLRTSRGAGLSLLATRLLGFTCYDHVRV